MKGASGWGEPEGEEARAWSVCGTPECASMPRVRGTALAPLTPSNQQPRRRWRNALQRKGAANVRAGRRPPQACSRMSPGPRPTARRALAAQACRVVCSRRGHMGWAHLWLCFCLSVVESKQAGSSGGQLGRAASCRRGTRRGRHTEPHRHQTTTKARRGHRSARLPKLAAAPKLPARAAEAARLVFFNRDQREFTIKTACVNSDEA